MQDRLTWETNRATGEAWQSDRGGDRTRGESWQRGQAVVKVKLGGLGHGGTDWGQMEAKGAQGKCVRMNKSPLLISYLKRCKFS